MSNICVAAYLMLIGVICVSLVVVREELDPPPFSIKFGVNDVSVSPFNVSDSPLTSNWNIYFTVENPNEKAVNYETADVSLFYHDQYLSYGKMSPFRQSGMDQTVVEVGLNASAVHVSDWVSSSITMDMTALGAVEFHVYMSGIVRTQPAGTVEEKKVRVGVSCEPMKIEFISNSTTVAGKMLGGSRKCHVRLRQHN